MRTFTALFVLSTALALTAAPSLARDITLPKTTTEQLKAACDKAGGRFSQDAKIYGCGTDCQGKPGTDCTVTCSTDQKCTAQVVGARHPRSVADTLVKPKGRDR